MRTIAQYNLQRNIFKKISKIFSVTDSLGNERLTISSNGNIGFGTVNPSAQLHINGNNIETGYVYVPYILDQSIIINDTSINDSVISRYGTAQVNSNYYSAITI